MSDIESSHIDMDVLMDMCHKDYGYVARPITL